MLFVDNQNNTDPSFNLALEEFLLRELTLEEPLLLFYINAPSVIVGRNQNTVEEIDQSYIDANNVNVVRRLSGGGAVYHDLGNLNYSFIVNGREQINRFSDFLNPVIETLNEMGVPATQGGNSDIVLDGKKLSGNAQYATLTRMFSHGTLLFDTNIEHMLNALNPRRVKIESKAVQSVRSAVTNIREALPTDMRIDELKARLLKNIFKSDAIPQYELSADDLAKVEQLRNERYNNWEWNVGRSPRFNIKNNGQFPYDKIVAHIYVEKGMIKTVKLFGAFFGEKPAEELEQQLKGQRFDRQSLEELLKTVDVSQFIAGISDEQFLALMLGDETLESTSPQNR
ncbi:MAG: lipoate--protein ligase [Chloroflexota bacterium]